MPKKVDDEKLIAVLLECGSVSAAASKLPLTRAAIYKRLADPELRERFEREQDAVISATSASLTAALDGAVEALVDVCRNPIHPPGTRIAAADSLLRHGLKYVEASNILRRLADLEATQND